MRSSRLTLIVAALLASLAILSCDDAEGWLGATLGNLVGETGNASCDRRFVADGGSRGPFCQEIIDTVATSQFEDDCRNKFQAATSGNKCDRAKIIAGCKMLKQNQDQSQVWDWYYDVSGMEIEAGVEAGTLFSNPPHTIDDVRAMCADPTRYSDGAELASP